MKRGIRKGGLFAVLALVAVLGLSAAAAAAIPSQGVCYNVRNSKLYDKNNVAPAINETVAKMKDGDRLYLQSGNYRFKETIKLAKDKDRLKNCTIVLEGVYTMDGSFDAMLIDAGWTEGKNWLNEVELPGMPNKSQVGYADYVLYDDTHRPLAVIEAKKTCVDPAKGRQQAKLYADLLEKKYGRRR